MYKLTATIYTYIYPGKSNFYFSDKFSLTIRDTNYLNKKEEIYSYFIRLGPSSQHCRETVQRDRGKSSFPRPKQKRVMYQIKICSVVHNLDVRYISLWHSDSLPSSLNHMRDS